MPFRPLSKSALTSALLLSPLFLSSNQAMSADLIVSAQRMPQEITESSAQVIKLDKEDIEALGASDIGDILASISAVQVSGDSIGVRGFNDQLAGNNVLIILNGRRLNLPDLANPDLSVIPVSQIQSIEVLTGNTGVIYGDQAVAAVIHITTSANPEAQVTVNADSFGGRSINVNQGFGSDEQWIGVSVTAEQLDGYRDNTDGTLYTGRLDGKHTNRFGANDWFLQATIKDQALPGALSLAELEADPTDSNTNFLNDYLKSTDYSLGTIQTTNLGNMDWTNEAFYMIYDYESTSSSSYGASTFVGEIDKSSIEYNSRLKVNSPLNLLLGADLQQSKLDYQLEYTVRDNTQTRAAVFSQVEIPVSKASIKVGARFENVTDDITDQLLYVTGETIGNSATAFDISVSQRLSDELDVSFEAGQNFRFAKIDEQAYTSPGVLGLKPQTGQQVSAAANWKTESVHLSLNLFQIVTQDEIIFDPNATKPIGAYFDGANVNADESSRLGASVSSKIQLQNQSLRLGLDWLDATFESGINNGNTIPWTSEWTATATYMQNINPSLQGTIGTRYESAKFLSGDDANSLEPTDATTKLNTSIQWIDGSWKVTASIDNLLNNSSFNSAYNYGAYYPADGRKYSLSVTKTGF